MRYNDRQVSVLLDWSLNRWIMYVGSYRYVIDQDDLPLSLISSVSLWFRKSLFSSRAFSLSPFALNVILIDKADGLTS